MLVCENAIASTSSKRRLYNSHETLQILFIIVNLIGIKYIIRIRLGLSHMCEHKFKLCLQDLINCCNDVESVIHFFLNYSWYSNKRWTLHNSFRKTDHKLLDSTDSTDSNIVFGNSTFTANDNKKIVILSIDFVLSTKRFNRPLSWMVTFFPLLFKQL